MYGVMLAAMMTTASATPDWGCHHVQVGYGCYVWSTGRGCYGGPPVYFGSAYRCGPLYSYIPAYGCGPGVYPIVIAPCTPTMPVAQTRPTTATLQAPMGTSQPGQPPPMLGATPDAQLVDHEQRLRNLETRVPNVEKGIGELEKKLEKKIDTRIDEVLKAIEALKKGANPPRGVPTPAAPLPTSKMTFTSADGEAPIEGKPEPTPTAAPGRVKVLLPEDARLFLVVGDQVEQCPLTSAERSFSTAVLQPGQDYAYTLKVEVTLDGRTVTASKQVVVRAGEETVVKFSLPRTVLTVQR
jgi:uncharacterized protein (TIGR03000 family)